MQAAIDETAPKSRSSHEERGLKYALLAMSSSYFVSLLA